VEVEVGKEQKKEIRGEGFERATGGWRRVTEEWRGDEETRKGVAKRYKRGEIDV
jgi:hypothetical protein